MSLTFDEKVPCDSVLLLWPGWYKGVDAPRNGGGTRQIQGVYSVYQGHYRTMRI